LRKKPRFCGSYRQKKQKIEKSKEATIKWEDPKESKKTILIRHKLGEKQE